MEAVIILSLAAGLLVFIFFLFSPSQERERERKERIYKKYGKTELAEKLIAKKMWVGETPEQLRDSLGEPLDIDEKVMKTKRREVWKYFHQGGNRYGLRLTLENDVLVGWDEKL